MPNRRTNKKLNAFFFPLSLWNWAERTKRPLLLSTPQLILIRYCPFIFLLNRNSLAFSGYLRNSLAGSGKLKFQPKTHLLSFNCRCADALWCEEGSSQGKHFCIFLFLHIFVSILGTKTALNPLFSQAAKTVKYGSSVDGISTAEPEQYAKR